MGFAINSPFTMRMLDQSASGMKSAIGIKSFLVIAAANVTRAVNHWHANGPPERNGEIGEWMTVCSA
jgi:hypothetical protein